MHKIYDTLNHILSKKCRNSEEQSIAISLVACGYVYEQYNLCLENMDDLDEVEQGIIKLIGQKLKTRNALQPILDYIKTKLVKVQDGVSLSRVLNGTVPEFDLYLQMYLMDICYDKGKIRNLTILKENKQEIEQCKQFNEFGLIFQ